MKFLIVIFCHIAWTYGQRNYNCVIQSLCLDGGTIDPRIVSPTNPVNPTPGQGNCPAGYIPCTDVSCGASSVAPLGTNGFAAVNSLPWNAFLQDALRSTAPKRGYAGGGVLIDQYHVLTAAHKVDNLTNVNVIMGVNDPATAYTGTQISAVAGAYVHTYYDRSFLKNDIAILRLATPINLDNTAMLACLPPAGTSYVGTTGECIVSGWGQTQFPNDDAPTTQLKQSHVPVVDGNTCLTSYSNPTLLGTNAAAYLDTANEICAGGAASQDACTQDGGSPLVCPSSANIYSVAGLVIWGKNCGQPGVYGVYVNTVSYAAWIQCAVACSNGATDCANCPATRIL